MSSASDYDHSDASEESSDESIPPARPTSRASRPQSQSRTSTPRKRRRLESLDPSPVRKYYLQGKYNDAYRVLYNEDVERAATRFDTSAEEHQYFKTQIGASTWSAREQATFFAALARLGRDDVPGLAGAIGTKSIPETQELLLLLHDAAAKQGDAKVTLRDIPAAIEVGNECNEQLELAGEALAWYQETFEANEEKVRFGDYWLITPEVAVKIEDALTPARPRATTSPLASEAKPRRRGGRVTVGACTSCQKYKQKCDRETPCGNCVRRKTGECVYPRNSVKPETGEQQDQSEQPGRVTASILEAIPEATLLHPQIMLILSKTLFMNRSPTIPSPWPHWSEYTSEFATEPAIYRTAFNDFHTLVVSVTRRLMQTAITQATSRLRSRRQRIKKGAIPLVKKKDVLAAIDMVGMKRDGKERWKGVARRCGLRVYDGKWSRYRNNRTRREVPWDEVEHILTVVEPLSEPLTTDADTSDNDAPNFKSRAGRSGTPLPMEQLALSDEHDDEESVDDSEELLSDEEERAHTVPPSRDFMGRYTSVPPTATDRQPASNVMTLEQFDKEAGRQEEHNLCKMLGLEPPNKDKEVKSDEDSDGDDFEHDDKITTHPNGWRSWVDYHAEWEDSSTPISPAEFTTNQKPLGAPPLLPPKTLIQAVSGSDDGIQGARAAESSSGDELDTNMSRQRSQRRSKHNAQQAIKLHARSALAYAALQSRAPQSARSANESKNDDTSDNNDAEENLPYRSPGAGNRLPPIDVPFEDDTSDADVDHPAQSVETGSKHSPVMVSEDESSDISVEMDRPKRSFETETRRPPVSNSDDEMGEMDWDTYIE